MQICYLAKCFLSTSANLFFPCMCSNRLFIEKNKWHSSSPSYLSPKDPKIINFTPRKINVRPYKSSSVKAFRLTSLPTIICYFFSGRRIFFRLAQSSYSCRSRSSRNLTEPVSEAEAWDLEFLFLCARMRVRLKLHGQDLSQGILSGRRRVFLSYTPESVNFPVAK